MCECASLCLHNSTLHYIITGTRYTYVEYVIVICFCVYHHRRSGLSVSGCCGSGCAGPVSVVANAGFWSLVDTGVRSATGCGGCSGGSTAIVVVDSRVTVSGSYQTKTMILHSRNFRMIVMLNHTPTTYSSGSQDTRIINTNA